MNTHHKNLPTVLASVVVRAAQHGESHGGLFLVDLASASVNQVLDWNQTINFDGRGQERGLRGIAFYNGLTYMASSRYIHIMKGFEEIDRIENHYIRSSHEIEILDDILYISSSWDCILRYHLVEKRFLESYYKDSPTSLRLFDPNKQGEILEKDQFHLNNLSQANGKIYYSTSTLPNLWGINHPTDSVYYNSLPKGTHNPTPYKGGVVYNESYQQRTVFSQGETQKIFPAWSFPEQELENLEEDLIARIGWTRGLCLSGDYIIAGSSPANISVYHYEEGLVQNICFSKDVRVCLHGLELYPYKALNV